jgi:uncharacterized membrane protein
MFFIAKLSLSAQIPESRVVFADDSSKTISYPVSVLSIIENKCIGCHSEQGRNEDAREALNWKNLQNMESGEVIGVLEEVLEQVEDGTMPPEKMVKKYPSLEMTAEERALLKAWIISMQAELDN